MQDDKEQESYIKPLAKMLTKNLTEKYVKEIIREAAKRAIENKEKANKLDRAWNSASEQKKEKYLEELEEKIANKIQDISTNEQEILRDVSDILIKDLDPIKIQKLSHSSPWWKRVLRSYWAKGFFGLIFIAVVAYLAVNMLFPAKLYLNTTELDFGTVGERAPPTLSFAIDNPGKVPLTWSVAADQPWIAVSQSSGTNAGIVHVSIVQGSLRPGDQRGNISVRSNVGEQKVTASLHAETPAKLGVYPESLDFVEIGRNPPAGKMLSVSNSGEMPLYWTASANVSWIALSKEKGINNGEIGVDIIGYMRPGIYPGGIAIQSNDSRLEIPVSIEVRKPPQLTVFPNPLDIGFLEQIGGNVSLPNPKNMTIRNDGGDVLNWTISKISDASWFTVDPSSGSIKPGDEEIIEVGIKPDLGQRDYSGNLSISSNGGNVTGTVKLKRVEMMMMPIEGGLLPKKLLTGVIPIIASSPPSNSTPQPASSIR